jgi:hypothetical protein
MATIQNRMAITRSVRVSALTTINETAKPTDAAERNQLAGADFTAERPHDDDNADQTERDGDVLPQAHALAEEADRQDRDPDRHGELDRHHLRDRDQGERRQPAALRGVVRRRCAPSCQPGCAVLIARRRRRGRSAATA